MEHISIFSLFKLKHVGIICPSQKTNRFFFMFIVRASFDQQIKRRENTAETVDLEVGFFVPQIFRCVCTARAVF